MFPQQPIGKLGWSYHKLLIDWVWSGCTGKYLALGHWLCLIHTLCLNLEPNIFPLPSHSDNEYVWNWYFSTFDDDEEDGVEIRGLVTDETRTKFGREFYEAFANRYREDGVNAAKVIVVEEKFSLGRRTIIEVKIDDNLVYQFLIKPDPESIRKHSESCLRYVKRYLIREKENAKRIKEY